MGDDATLVFDIWWSTVCVLLMLMPLLPMPMLMLMLSRLFRLCVFQFAPLSPGPHSQL